MYTKEKDGRRILVCTVGGTVLLYDLRRVNDLHTMLKKAGDRVELGGADEQNPAKDGMVETWVARKPTRWGGLVRFEERSSRTVWRLRPADHGELGLCELEHNIKNNRIPAK